MASATSTLNVVTGAFSYTGKHITQRLLAMGEGVRTLTGHADRPSPFGDRVSVAPYSFDSPAALAKSMEGATTLYNTYWVRFPRGGTTFEEAVGNTRTLIQAAQEAGVRRIVHVSITNASEDSPLPYFRGKGLVEKAVQHSRLSYAILRPTVIFGLGDILVNNIAWFLRRSPVFGIFGRGDYSVQPVYVEDVASLAVEAGHREEDVVLDAVGPETYTFEALVRLIARKVGRRARIVHLPPPLVLLLLALVGRVVHDVVLTRDEVRGLMAGLLVSSHPPLGKMPLSMWLDEHASVVGVRYASELRRHYD